MGSGSDERPLWLPEDQAARLDELLGTEVTARERPLRRDVRNLGLLLGRILKAQSGTPLFATEETLRQLAVGLPATGPGSAGQIGAFIRQQMDTRDALRGFGDFRSAGQ